MGIQSKGVLLYAPSVVDKWWRTQDVYQARYDHTQDTYIIDNRDGFVLSHWDLYLARDMLYHYEKGGLIDVYI